MHSLITNKTRFNINLAISCTVISMLAVQCLHAQQKCVTTNYNTNLHQSDDVVKLEFESWLASRKGKSQFKIIDEAIYRIPVVVHVIHRGETEGEGMNIPEEQIRSQIKSLTEDFRRQNTDTASTPDIFKSVAVDTRIEFELAKQDPTGIPTDGIVRVDGGKNSWSFEEDFQLKSLSYWPAEDYFNIWVTDLEDNVLGYAQFPVSDELDGLESGSEKIAETDGVVVDYRWFGTGYNATSQSRGRVLTHEVGHYLGLRHIWGDASFPNQGCSVDDYCEDTPNTNTNFNGCDLSNAFDISCSNERAMIENYMDYTDDACMNLFTSDQLGRMHTVLENSPRRTSLLSSPGLIVPIVYATDIEFSEILSPQSLVCDDEISPMLRIRNIGSGSIQQLEIEYTLNGISNSIELTNLDVAYLENYELEFPDLTIEDFNSISFNVIKVNNTSDQRQENNSIFREFSKIPEGELPINSSFDELPLNWEIINPDQGITWELEDVTIDGRNENVLLIDNFNYPNVGAEDLLLSPLFNVPVDIVDSLSLSFNLAYAASSFGEDGLEIRLYDGCEQFSNNTYEIVYFKEGTDLASFSSNSRFSLAQPSEEEDWRLESIDLISNLNSEDFLIGFAAMNGYGNRLYLDDFNLDFKLKKFDGGKEMLVYPNPGASIFNLEFRMTTTRDLNVSVIDLTGKVVNTFPLENVSYNTFSFDFSSLEQSVYLLKIDGQGFSEVQKLVVSR